MVEKGIWEDPDERVAAGEEKRGSWSRVRLIYIASRIG